jgi:hypothetical protein
MNGPRRLADYVIGVAILSATCLSSSLIGPELAIIFLGTIALLIALNQTPSLNPAPVNSQKASRPSLSLPPNFIPPLPESPQPRLRKRSKHLEAVQRSLSFEDIQ